MGSGVGGFVYISDENENVSKVSTAGRLYFSQSYTRIKKHSPINVSAGSGGSTFESVGVARVYLRSESGNGIMWWGGTSDDAPYSGNGFPLYGGETSPVIRVTNFNAVRIVASVSGQIVYPIGFLDGVDILLSNTTATQPDLIAPYLISHSPVSGLSGLALNSEITATFSEPISQSSLTSGSFRLSPAHNVMIFRDTLNTSKIVMSPNTDMSGSTVYMVEVTANITDLVGNPISGGNSITWPFTTINTPPPPDTTPPVVSGTSPVDGATGVSIDTDVTITFSEQMLSGTINATNIFLSKTSGGSIDPISYSVSLSAVDNKTATINPTSSLDTGSIYYINVLTGVQDLASNSMTNADRGRNFTPIYNFTEVYNVSVSSSDIMSSFWRLRIGEEILSNCTLIGITPKRVTMRLLKASAPTGNATLVIRNSSDTIVSTIGTIDVSTIATGAEAVDYTITNLNQSHAFEAGDRILLEYSGGDASNYILVYKSGSFNPFAFAEYTTFTSSAYTDVATRDVAWIIYS